MSNANPIKVKSYKFALNVIHISGALRSKGHYDLARQIIKSGTSIGANVEEALGASTKKEFIYKLSIAYREARESEYWIRLLRDSNNLAENESDKLLDECRQLIRLLTSIIKSSKANA